MNPPYLRPSIPNNRLLEPPRSLQFALPAIGFPIPNPKLIHAALEWVIIWLHVLCPLALGFEFLKATP